MSVKWKGDLGFFEDSVVLPNDSGEGIRLGKHDETDSFGWRDITVQVIARGVGATDPTWAQVDSTSMYAYKFDFGLANSPLTTANTVTATQAAGAPYTHMVTETSAVTIPGLTEPDGMIYFRLRRISNTTSPVADQAAGVFLVTSDLHYQSTNMATKQRSPNFYAD